MFSKSGISVMYILAKTKINVLVKERKKKLAIYKDRRKNEADDGVINGFNNW